MEPVNVADFERLAEERLDAGAWGYFTGGAGDEWTLRENVAAFGRRQLRPRVLVDVSEPTTRTSVLGAEISMPLLVAPVAFQRMAHPDGEAGMARAAAAAGTIFCLSTMATTTPAEVAAAAPDAPRWFQLYWFREERIARSLVEQAADAGFAAVVLTVDAPRVGRRERDVRSGFALPADVVVPAYAQAAGGYSGGTPVELLRHINSALSWRDLERLASDSPLPVVLKGVLTAEDAVLAAEHGAAAIVVSNHGGRQLDGVPATLDVLPEVVDAVGGRIEVLVDGGVRRGTDVLKALALGARAVLAGRAPLYGLAAAGEEGARRVLELLRDEIELGLVLLGCASPADVSRAHVRPAGPRLSASAALAHTTRALPRGAGFAGPADLVLPPRRGLTGEPGVPPCQATAYRSGVVTQAAERSRIADPSLAPEGEGRIAWVARHSPVLNRLARERLADGALRGKRLAVVVHLEAKTAYLATLFAEAGAEVVVAGSNPGTTQDAICAALVARGIEVHGRRGISYDEWEDDLLAAADAEPELIVDDGAELTARLLEHRPQLAERVLGVSEETTTGVARLRALERAGKLPLPAIAANDAWCKHLFDNRYGTGHSALLAILELTNLVAAGKTFCVVGYGWVGKGLAKYAEGMGGRVVVVDVDPVAALEAYMDGHRVAPLEQALPDADVVVTATGVVGALGADAIPHLKDGVLLANAGHHDREIEVEALGPGEEVRPGITQHELPGGGAAYVLVDGRLVNIAGAEGHPVEIMDLSFSVQALAARHLATAQLPAGVHRLPPELDREIARTKLATLGIELAEATPARLGLVDE